MLSLIIGIGGMLVGVIITWIIARHYYFRATKDQATLFYKLDDSLRKTILNDQREKLSVKELNEILTSKTLDENYKGKLPFKACPKCGSENLQRGIEYDVEHDGENFIGIPYGSIVCIDCGWVKTDFNEI